MERTFCVWQDELDDEIARQVDEAEREMLQDNLKADARDLSGMRPTLL